MGITVWLFISSMCVKDLINLSLSFLFQSTVYVYSDVRHMKMCERAGVRHIKVMMMMMMMMMMMYTCIAQALHAVIAFLEGSKL